MPFADLLNTPAQHDPTRAAFRPTDSFDILSEGIPAMAMSTAVAPLWDYTNQSENSKIVRERFGKDPEDITGVDAKFSSFLLGDVGGYLTYKEKKQQHKQKFDELVIDARKRGDKQWEGIKTYKELSDEVSELGKQEEEEFQNALQKSKGLSSTVGGVVGSALGGLLVDPINLATLPLGVSAATGTMRAIKMEALLNAAIEAGQVPLHKKWAERVGRKYGIQEAALDIGTAGLSAGALTGLIRGIGKVAEIAGIKSMQVLDRLANAKNLTSEQREAAKYLSRSAHLDEEIPFPDIGKVEPTKITSERELFQLKKKADEDLLTHRGAIDETQASFKENRQPVFTDAVKRLTREYTKPEKPQDIIEFIIENGGISRDETMLGDILSKDLRHINKGYFGSFINKNGKYLDELREAAEQAGFIGKIGVYQESTIDDLLDAIDETLAGNPRFARADESKAQKYYETVAANNKNDVLYDAADTVFERISQRGERGISDTDLEKMANKYINNPEMDVDTIIDDFLERQGIEAFSGEEIPVLQRGEELPKIDELEAAIKDIDVTEQLASFEAKMADIIKNEPDFEIDGKTAKQLLEEFADEEAEVNAVRTCQIK